MTEQKADEVVTEQTEQDKKIQGQDFDKLGDTTHDVPAQHDVPVAPVSGVDEKKESK